MSNYPLGANEDRNAPWHEKELHTTECPDCEGKGVFSDVSECCAEKIIRGDLCSNCLEHCGPLVCETCEGTGRVVVPDEEPDPDMYRDEI